MGRRKLLVPTVEHMEAQILDFLRLWGKPLPQVGLEGAARPLYGSRSERYAPAAAVLRDLTQRGLLRRFGGPRVGGFWYGLPEWPMSGRLEFEIRGGIWYPRPDTVYTEK